MSRRGWRISPLCPRTSGRRSSSSSTPTYSDHPEQLPLLVDPILDGEADFVLGSRMLKPQPHGALLPQAIFGNKLACFLMRVAVQPALHRPRALRAISWDGAANDLTDARHRISGGRSRCRSRRRDTSCASSKCAVDYRPRIGYSKITGTLCGTLRGLQDSPDDLPLRLLRR